jgi:polar amino acid transport system permease protein
LAAFLALGLNSGAYQAEYLRGSILAIGEGQMTAGRAIGMSKWQTVLHIILPQSLRLAIPAWANEPVSLLKSTAVVFLIAVPELMAQAKGIAARTYDPIGAYIAVSIVYLVVVYLLDAGIKWGERRTRIPGFEMEGRKA